MTPSATTVASGAQVSFTGTIAPPQPGRSDVKIQRRTKHTCQKATNGQEVCQDEWETITTATTAAGGASLHRGGGAHAVRRLHRGAPVPPGKHHGAQRPLARRHHHRQRLTTPVRVCD